MIFNVVDKREHKHRWKRITAIVEPVWHDNSVNNGDCYYPNKKEESCSGLGYLEMPTISVAMAIEAASELDYACTLYLYDHGKGINTVHKVMPNEYIKDQN